MADWYLIVESSGGKLISETGSLDNIPDNEILTQRGLEVITVTSRPDWGIKLWDAANKIVIDRVAGKAEIESRIMQALYAQWQMWKTTRLEAQARGMAAGVITALTNKEDNVWTDYVAAIQDWRNAN